MLHEEIAPAATFAFASKYTDGAPRRSVALLPITRGPPIFRWYSSSASLEPQRQAVKMGFLMLKMDLGEGEKTRRKEEGRGDDEAISYE